MFFVFRDGDGRVLTWWVGVPMEVMGLMLGEFVDDYTVRVVDVGFASFLDGWDGWGWDGWLIVCRSLRCLRAVRAFRLKLLIRCSRLR